VEKTAKKLRNFVEAEKADRDFYKKLTVNERLRSLAASPTLPFPQWPYLRSDGAPLRRNTRRFPRWAICL
jgi:hypothetical protein